MGARRRVDDLARERRARRDRGSIAFRFHARDAHLVLSTGAQEPIPFRVLLDGRLYQLVRQAGEVRERTLEITLPAPGAAAYSFTFG